ncbi:MAG: hypothetical protein DI538_21845 [Azospira oryzae]|nr:MAG: hypothetical protein DI538_21845 [Azospira oryzae]
MHEPKRVIIMKTKTLYSIGAALSLTIGIATAQTPTPSAPPAPGTNYNTSTALYGTQINNSAIPDPLRSTLQGTQYKGWENGTMYFNPSTNQYSLQMPSPAGTTPSVNPLAPASPSTPMPSSPVQGTTPTTPNPMGGLQAQPVTPGLPTVVQPATIYRFDQSGKLIPQN